MGEHGLAPRTARAVFLDRDGVLNRPVIRDAKPYPPRSVEELELLPGVIEACHRLKNAGWLLVVATNQPDVGRGTLAREAVEAIHNELARKLPLDRIEVCYDSGRESPPSEDRKPGAGMLRRAAGALNIALDRSFMVGDRWRDIDCGCNAGCRTIFIDWNYDEELRQVPDHRVRDLGEAADYILQTY